MASVSIARGSCAEIVCRMPKNQEALRLARESGLYVGNVSWEDNARTKDSCWGPCISDMTLSVDGRDMPLIKTSSNFNDETWDVEIEKIPIIVGNHNSTELKTVTLKEYLGNLRDYLHAPEKWLGDIKSLLIDNKDQYVICSAQACFLPLAADGEAKFNVSIFNYQARPEDPAVLSIVASVNGTSARVLDSRSKLHLFHNNNGQRASYVGQRLSDFRRETGSELPDDAPMTASERSQNMLLVIQVPLKQKPSPKKRSGGGGRGGSSGARGGRGGHTSGKKCKRSYVDVESAIIKVGEDEGEYSEINDLTMERDTRFPIRVTMLYYKATSNGEVNADVLKSIAEELQGARKWAVAISSLVTETTDRTTEHSQVPSWWPSFWAEHAVRFGQWSANDARNVLFANNRFAAFKLNEVRTEIISILEGKLILMKMISKPEPKNLPQWDVV